MTELHQEHMTYKVVINIPAHEDRVATPLFIHTRHELLETDTTCYICNRTAEEAGHPLEVHHHPIERSLANMVDWELVKRDFPNFDWDQFDPTDPYFFVDDMRYNGVVLCKEHHIGKNQGIHMMPYPFWIIQRYAKAGYQFTDEFVIQHTPFTEPTELYED